MDAKAAVDGWYKEHELYRKGDPFSSLTGHFTQLVWKTSTKLGCAIRKCGGGNAIYCTYSERGNLQGAFLQNVDLPSQK